MSMFLVDRMGRKPLLILSTFGSGLSIFALGTFFYFDEKKCLPNRDCSGGFSQELIDSLKWMPVVSTNCHNYRSEPILLVPPGRLHFHRNTMGRPRATPMTMGRLLYKALGLQLRSTASGLTQQPSASYI